MNVWKLLYLEETEFQPLLKILQVWKSSLVGHLLAMSNIVYDIAKFSFGRKNEDSTADHVAFLNQDDEMWILISFHINWVFFSGLSWFWGENVLLCSQIFLVLQDLFYWFIWKGQREVISISLDRTKQKPVAWNSWQASIRVAGPQALGPSFSAIPNTLAGMGLEVEQPGLELAPIWMLALQAALRKCLRFKRNLHLKIFSQVQSGYLTH